MLQSAVVPEQVCLQQPFELSETVTLSYHVTRLYCSVNDVCEYSVNLITVVINTYLSYFYTTTSSSGFLVSPVLIFILTATAVLSSETPYCC